jgi:hypothetical protein
MPSALGCHLERMLPIKNMAQPEFDPSLVPVHRPNQPKARLATHSKHYPVEQ